MMERKMPDPWFRAQNLNSPIITVLERSRHNQRALRLGERMVGAFILPPFQRPPVWTQRQQVRLIESIWGRLPIGAYVYNLVSKMDHPCDGWLLDGQQRVTAIVNYVDGAFAVHGYRFPDLSRAERLGFEMMPIACLQTQIEDESGCRDVYDRLAYGGTAHEPPLRQEGSQCS